MIKTQKHKEDLATFEVKSAEYKQFLAENEADLGTDARIYGLASKMNAELKSLRSRLEDHVKIAGLHSDATDFAACISDPAERKDASVKSLNVLGTVADGHSEVDLATKSMLSQIGGGIVGEKAWDACQDPAYAKAFSEYLRKGERMSAWAYKNLEVGLDSQAGQLAPIDWIAKLIQRKPTPTRIAGKVTAMTTGRDALVMPKFNYNGASDDLGGSLYTTGFRVTSTEENPTSDTQALVNDSNLVGSLRIENNTWLIEGVLTNNMVEDTALDIQGLVQGKFQETIDLLKDNMLLNGNGTGQPMGMINLMASAPGDGQIQTIDSTNVGGLAIDDIVNISMDVPEQYEENLGFLFNKTNCGKKLRGLKDGSGRLMFAYGAQDNGMASGKPTDLNGYPYQYSGFMPNVATGNVPILFGDLTGYILLNRLGFYVQVLREVAARRNQIILLGRVRFGGNLAEPWKLRGLKIR